MEMCSVVYRDVLCSVWRCALYREGVWWQMTVPGCPLALRIQGRRPDRLQAGCGAKRNPCKKYDNKSEPRRGDRILSYLRHLYSTGINSRGFVLRTSHPACNLIAPSGLKRWILYMGSSLISMPLFCIKKSKIALFLLWWGRGSEVLDYSAKIQKIIVTSKL